MLIGEFVGIKEGKEVVGSCVGEFEEGREVLGKVVGFVLGETEGIVEGETVIGRGFVAKKKNKIK